MQPRTTVKHYELFPRIIPTLAQEHLDDLIVQALHLASEHEHNALMARLEVTWPGGPEGETDEQVLVREASWPKGSDNHEASVEVLSSASQELLMKLDWPGVINDEIRTVTTDVAENAAKKCTKTQLRQAAKAAGRELLDLDASLRFVRRCLMALANSRDGHWPVSEVVDRYLSAPEELAGIAADYMCLHTAYDTQWLELQPEWSLAQWYTATVSGKVKSVSAKYKVAS
jgi:hypothetical protein